MHFCCRIAALHIQQSKLVLWHVPNSALFGSFTASGVLFHSTSRMYLHRTCHGSNAHRSARFTQLNLHTFHGQVSRGSACRRVMQPRPSCAGCRAQHQIEQDLRDSGRIGSVEMRLVNLADLRCPPMLCWRQAPCQWLLFFHNVDSSDCLEAQAD